MCVAQSAAGHFITPVCCALLAFGFYGIDEVGEILEVQFHMVTLGDLMVLLFERLSFFRNSYCTAFLIVCKCAKLFVRFVAALLAHLCASQEICICLTTVSIGEVFLHL